MMELTSRQPYHGKHDYRIMQGRAEMYKGDLILVNQHNPVRQSAQHIEALSVAILQAGHAEEQQISLESRCIGQLSALLDACQAKGKIAVVSGYRSRETQERIYETSLKENGEAFTASYVALPDASEHQTGLAVDVGLYEGEIDYIRPSFPDDGVSGVFKQLAADYGFIQRYQENKEAITGIACEPWHYRYVGYPHSVIMKQQDLCLEEYTEYVKQFSYNKFHLYIEDSSSVIEIYYVMAEGELTTVPIVNGYCYQHSGNNQDGYVVTVFHRKGDGSCE